MTARQHRWRCLWFAIVCLFALRGAAATGIANDSLAASEPSEALRVPPVPSDYVRVRRGPIDLEYPPAIEDQVHAAIVHVDSDARVVATQLGLAEPVHVEVRLVPDADAMRRLAPLDAPPPAYASGVAYPAIGLALVSAREPESGSATDVRLVLRHEMSHLLLRVAAGRDVPRWLSEGIAVDQSGEANFERFRALAVASFTRGLVPFRRLDAAFSEGGDRVTVAYAESADFVSYLARSEGAPRFGVLLSHLREGLSLDEAARQTYGASLTQLEFEWQHDVEMRFLTAPLWAGTGFFWIGAAVLLVFAFLRRRAVSQKILERWSREEAAVPPAGVLIVSPGLAGSIDGAQRSLADDDRPKADGEIPEIDLDGERHTLH